MKVYAPTEVVLVDIDGTLLDSNDAHARSWEQTFAAHGRPVPFERIRPLIGKGGDKLLCELAGIDDRSEEGRRLTQDRRGLFLERFLKDLRPTRGARALLERLRGEGVGLFVATSASSELVEALLRQANVEGLFDGTTSSGDAAHSKPDPDIVQAALRLSGRPACEAMMLGDTPYDIEAAARAEVDTIALRCGGWWDDRALAGAVALYDDPQALLDDFERSPIARRRQPAD